MSNTEKSHDLASRVEQIVMCDDAQKEPLFPAGSIVSHIKSCGLYTIIRTPKDDARIEKENKPFYEYMGDRVTWVRPQDEMEDGRFIQVIKCCQCNSWCTKLSIRDVDGESLCMDCISQADEFNRTY